MRHHFVPKFLLRAWSEGASDGCLQEFRLDLEGVPSFRRPPVRTGYQDGLYALTEAVVAGMSQNAVETHLWSPIDNYAARVRTKMVQYGLKSLSIKERRDWVRFLTSLRIRQPNIVNKLVEESRRAAASNAGISTLCR
jgi:hypothetical protein